MKNRRRFFEEYAKEKGFDHKIPNNWYSQSRKKIESKKVVVEREGKESKERNGRRQRSHI